MTDKTLTTKDIAQYCQVTQRTVVQWIKEGKFKCFRTPGKHIRVNPDDFIKFLNLYHMPIPEVLKAMMNVTDKKKVLIVDDDKGVVDAMKRLLTLENKFEVDVAYDGFEAGQKFMSGKPDLVILDIRMPRVDGYKLCSAIRNNPENINVKILVVSGLIDDKDKKMLTKSGANDYLTKPFDIKDLIIKINSLFNLNRRAEDRN